MYEFYKIKHPFYEQYSAGLKRGYIHKSKKGKTWNSIGAIRNHFTAVKVWDKDCFDLFYDNWLVIKITENGIETLGTVKEMRNW